MFLAYLIYFQFLECDGGFMKNYGVINEEGTEIHLWGFTNDMEKMIWLSDEEIEKIKEDRESADAPECKYFKSQPDNLGKLFWLSGNKIHVLLKFDMHLHISINCDFRSTWSW